jgi:putative glutamine amidotransferase
MKPIIGVTPDFNPGDREDMGGREPTYFLRARYPRAIEAAGGVPLILPLTADPALRQRLLSKLDGLLLTGSGPDLHPELYGERQRFRFRVMSRQRSDFELELTRLAARTGMPTLGICGGMQVINVALGGSLVQDIPVQLGTALAHRPASPATRTTHSVLVAPHSLLRRITRRAEIQVNSSHHQAVKKLAASLLATAVAPDGVIEAIESQRHPFLLGVQWHPEFLFDRHEVHRRLFLAFVKAASRAAS